MKDAFGNKLTQEEIDALPKGKKLTKEQLDKVIKDWKKIIREKNKLGRKIEKIDIFEYRGYVEPPSFGDNKNELWVQLLLLQNKVNELVDVVNKLLEDKK